MEVPATYVPKQVEVQVERLAPEAGDLIVIKLDEGATAASAQGAVFAAKKVLESIGKEGVGVIVLGPGVEAKHVDREHLAELGLQPIEE